MHSIRKYRNWAVLLLVLFAATTVVAGTLESSRFATSVNTALAPNGTTAPKALSAGGPARPHAINKTPKPVPQRDAKSVLVIWADVSEPLTLIAGLEAYGHTVTSYEGYYQTTPDASYMEQFGAVVVWSNYPFNNSVTMGNNLADYVDAGGRVVVGMFSYCNWAGYYMQGRLAEETPYQALEYNVGFGFGLYTTNWLDPSSPITAGLTAMSDIYEAYTHAVPTATLLGTQDGGYDFCALSQNEEVVAINLYPGDPNQATGPWIQLIHQAIEFSAGPPLDVDAGVAGITAPGTLQDPGTPVAPLIKIKNFGGLPQSNIPVTVRIWDPTPALVYNNTQTYAGPLAAGDTVTIHSFPAWTPGSAIQYACTTFTSLPGDMKAANDTAKRTVATIGWKDIPPPSEDADRLGHGVVYDPIGDMLYMFGGCPAGNMGTNMTKLQRYDPNLQEWQTMAPMATARDWIHGSCINGKIYVIGGMDNSGNQLAVNECYDIATNTWSTKTPCPRTVFYHFEVTYNDLIYIMAGNNTTTVNIYNPATDAWQTGTSLPLGGGIGSAAVIGDTIYIMQAFDDNQWLAWPNMYKGAINPADPTQINWIQGPAMNPMLIAGGTVSIDDAVYSLGGFHGSWGNSASKEMYRYQQSTGAVDNWAVANYPAAIGKNNFLAVRKAGPVTQIYGLAGDINLDWSAPNNLYKVLTLPAKPLDLAVTKINAPANAQLVPGSVVAPACSVANYGTIDAVAAPVRLIVTDASAHELFNGTVPVSVAAGATAEVVFPDLTIPDSLFIGRVLAFRTELPGDQRPYNDGKTLKTMTLSDEVYSNAGMPAPVIDGYMDAGEWDNAYTFDCSNIFGWRGAPQGPGAAQAWFKNDANYLYVAFKMPTSMSRDIGDQVGLCIDENNDGAWASGLTEGEYRIWVNGSGADEIQYRYHAPTGAFGQWTTVVGSQSMSNADNGLVFEGAIPIGAQPYKISLNNASNDTVGLYLTGIDNGSYLGWFKAGLSATNWNAPAQYGKLVFRTLQSGDVGVSAINAPINNVLPNTAVTPSATWHNYGTTPMTGTAYLFLTDPLGARVYTQSQPLSLAGGANGNPTFAPYTVVDTGTWAVKCSTVAVGDNNPANDIRNGTFTVRLAVANPGWHAKSNIPGATFAKDGGALAYNGDQGLVYEMKGNKTLEFYSYNPVDTSWTTLAPIPAGTKPVKGGASMATGAGKVFVTKGNNTLEFYRYNIADSTWLPATKTVPLGAGKKVKAGGSMAFVSKPEDGGDFVYLLKGYGTEFYRYDVAADSFSALTPAPAGAKPKYDKGSWIAYDGSQYIYVNKAKYNEFYKYDVLAEAWVTAPVLPGMPLVNPSSGKSKKVGDGSAAAFGNGALYALKGNNVNVFWKYTPGGTWAELETVPQVAVTGDKKKKVKSGAALAYVPDMAAFYAQKGNKSNQFWQYGPSSVMFAERPTRDGVAAGSVTNVTLAMAVGPNPLATGYATLRYSLPKSGVVMLNVYDVTGRSVITRTLNTGRTGSTALDLRNLSAGVYLVKLSSDSFQTSQKLVVER